MLRTPCGPPCPQQKPTSKEYTLHSSDKRQDVWTWNLVSHPYHQPWTPKAKIQTDQLVKNLPEIPIMLQKKTVIQNSKLN